MPRRKRIFRKRIVEVDPYYRDQVVGKFINCMMWDGKKTTNQITLKESFDIIESKMKMQPLEVFKKAIDNVKPLVEVRSRRVGGANYQVPVEVRSERKLSLSMRWIILNARERSGHTMAENLAEELMDAFQKKGGAVKKREDVHRMAEANKAFAHYRW